MEDEAVEPSGYGELLEQLKERVRTAQVRAVRAANTEVLRLYWSIGRDILERQQTAGWGAKVVARLAADLRREFPEQRGWSRTNLLYMRRTAEVWPTVGAFVQQAVGQLPWGHVTVLLDRLRETGLRDWYAAQAVEHGWSRAVLEHQIRSELHRRIGAAPSNFSENLSNPDSELAQQLVKDPYVFDHLALTAAVREHDVEKGLMDKLQETLLELGHGMAFVGRQVRFTVEGDELIVDLLLFNVDQVRYVVVELKIGTFEPGFVGQLGTYVAMVDDRLRKPDLHAPTVGILLCAGRNEAIVRYALAATAAPMAIASYTYETLPADQRAALPGPGELAAIVTSALPEDVPLPPERSTGLARDAERRSDQTSDQTSDEPGEVAEAIDVPR